MKSHRFVLLGILAAVGGAAYPGLPYGIDAPTVLIASGGGGGGGAGGSAGGNTSPNGGQVGNNNVSPNAGGVIGNNTNPGTGNATGNNNNISPNAGGVIGGVNAPGAVVGNNVPNSPKSTGASGTGNATGDNTNVSPNAGGVVGGTASPDGRTSGTVTGPQSGNTGFASVSGTNTVINPDGSRMFQTDGIRMVLGPTNNPNAETGGGSVGVLPPGGYGLVGGTPGRTFYIGPGSGFQVISPEVRRLMPARPSVVPTVILTPLSPYPGTSSLGPSLSR